MEAFIIQFYYLSPKICIQEFTELRSFILGHRPGKRQKGEQEIGWWLPEKMFLNSESQLPKPKHQQTPSDSVILCSFVGEP